MALLLTKVLLNTLLLIVVTVLTDHFEKESFQNFENIFDFSVALINETNNVLDYAMMIQALFCPEQPICTAEAEKNKTDVLNTLTEIFEIGNEAIRIEDVHKIVAACCMPCSCDTKTCKENGNCCLSKTVADALENNPDMDDQNAVRVFEILNDDSDFTDENVTAVYSECIQASWISYRDKDAFEIASDLDIPGYYMITQCFENNASQEDVKKCQKPSEYTEEAMLPVISSETGRIYWNSYCARCNNDGRDVSPWIASVRFDIDIVYFINYSYPSVPALPDTYNDVREFISQTGNIVYTPPFPQEDKLCLRKKLLKTCTDYRNKPTGSWLERACERIYSPLIIESILGMRFSFLNIFCYLCRRQYFRPNANRQCGYAESHAKDMSVGMSALLDFVAPEGINEALAIAPRQDKCRCDEIYDFHLHICRIVYCPAGDFMVDCQCIRPFKMVFGIPMLLTVKLIPNSGYLQTLATKQIPKYHDTLKKTLHAISANVSIEFIGLFECKADPEDYFLSLAVVRSYPGHDTKEVIKPFLYYLDNTGKMEMVVNRNTYSVRLTSRIRLWTWYNLRKMSEHHSNFRDLESTVQNHSILFENNDITKAYDQEFQVLSPLLYCMQIQLDDTEFEVKGEQLTTLRTAGKITISYYRWTSESTVRVCTDQYMNKEASNIGIKVSHSRVYLYVVLMIRYGSLLVFQRNLQLVIQVR